MIAARVDDFALLSDSFAFIPDPIYSPALLPSEMGWEMMLLYAFYDAGKSDKSVNLTQTYCRRPVVSEGICETLEQADDDDTNDKVPQHELQ